MLIIKHGFSVRFLLSLMICLTTSGKSFADDDSQQTNALGNDMPDVGAGYNKLSNTYLPSCFSNVVTTSPTEIEETAVTYSDDLNEESFRNIFDLDLSAKIPIQNVVTLNPKLVFSRDAATTNLSHNSTYIAYAHLGQKTLVPYQANKLVLKPQFRQYFDANGNLTNVYDFVRLCGDELINSQKLGSKLVMTLKLSFQSTEDKLSVEGDLGVSPTIAPSWSFNVKFKDVDIQVRKRLRINFYAIQLGGQPERLLGAMGSTTCTLDDITKCQAILDQLRNYLVNDYSKQLVATATDRWTVEDIQSLPYYLSDIYDDTGKQLTFGALSNPDILDKLDQLKLEGQRRTAQEQKNFQLASMMKQMKYLATDEQATLNEITTLASANIQRLQLFGNQCYNDLDQCVDSNINDTFSKIITPYDASLLGVNIGVLISKVYANTKSSAFFNTRASSDFVILQPELREGVYSSYYVKFKNLKNNVIKNNTVTVDISCLNLFMFPMVLMSRAFQYYEVLNPQMQINYKSKCNDKNALFVASPVGFSELLAPDTQFIVELWGRS